MHFAGDATSVSAAAQEQSMSRVFCHGIIFSTAVGGFWTVSITNLYTSVWWDSWVDKFWHLATDPSSGDP